MFESVKTAYKKDPALRKGIIKKENFINGGKE